MSSSLQSEDVIGDIEKCIQFLTNLEQRWSGASRSRVIIEQLLALHRHHYSSTSVEQAQVGRDYSSTSSKRKLPDFESEDNLFLDDSMFWQGMPGSDLLEMDLSDLMSFNAETNT